MITARTSNTRVASMRGLGPPFALLDRANREFKMSLNAHPVSGSPFGLFQGEIKRRRDDAHLWEYMAAMTCNIVELDFSRVRDLDTP